MTIFLNVTPVQKHGSAQKPYFKELKSIVKNPLRIKFQPCVMTHELNEIKAELERPQRHGAIKNDDNIYRNCAGGENHEESVTPKCLWVYFKAIIFTSSSV